MDFAIEKDGTQLQQKTQLEVLLVNWNKLALISYGNSKLLTLESKYRSSETFDC